MNGANGGVTLLLHRARRGDEDALDQLMHSVYGELRLIASRQLRRSSGNEMLETTALVHEAFLRLARSEQPEWADRCHFFAVAATAMRQILVDFARRRSSEKRGGGWKRVDFESARLDVEEQTELILEIDTALRRLSELNPRLTRVVECRFFAGMTETETATALEITDRTVRRDWIKARAWLHLELGLGEQDPGTSGP